MSERPGPGPGGHGTATPPTRLLTPGFVALFAAGLVFFVAGGLVLPVASRFAAGPLGADSIGVGVAIGVYSIAALLLRPVVGWASDRYGRRPLLIGGGALTVAALALHLAVDSLGPFIVVRSLLGIGEAFFFVAAVAAISDLAPEGRRGEAINVGSLAVYLGLALGPIIGEAVHASGGYTAVWLAAAALAVAATGLTLLVPETAPTVVAPTDRPPVAARLIHPAGLFPGFLILTGAWGMAGYFAFMPLHAREIGMEGASVAFALYALIVVALRIAFVKLPDQVGPARLSGAALVVTSVGLGIVAAAGAPTGLLLGTAVFASGVAFLFPGLVALAVSRVDDTGRGSVVGTASAFLDLSYGLSPAVLGVVAGVAGFAAAMAVSSGVALAGAGLLYARRGAVGVPGMGAPDRLPG